MNAAGIDWPDADEDHPGGVRGARDGGKLVIVATTVENTWTGDIMPWCYDVDVALYGDNGAEYGPISDFPLYPANPGCAENLGVGFSDGAHYVFEIPEDVAPVEFGFGLSDSVVPGADEGRIAIDDVNTASDGPDPTPGNRATTTATTTTAATTATQPAASSPAYGSPCSPSQVNQPGTAADGTPLVCVGTGAGNHAWVHGPEPRGVGTASDGGECVDGETGGQDDQGRMMMCVDGRWVYGP